MVKRQKVGDVKVQAIDFTCDNCGRFFRITIETETEKNYVHKDVIISRLKQLEKDFQKHNQGGVVNDCKLCHRFVAVIIELRALIGKKK